MLPKHSTKSIREFYRAADYRQMFNHVAQQVHARVTRMFLEEKQPTIEIHEDKVSCRLLVYLRVYPVGKPPVPLVLHLTEDMTFHEAVTAGTREAALQIIEKRL